MSTQTVPDISELVDEAFDECAAGRDRGTYTLCGGGPAAYLVLHGCDEGIICKRDLDAWLQALAHPGLRRCTHCGLVGLARDLAKIYPL